MVTRLRAANRQLMREINTSIVLGLIRQQGPISRTEIAHLANLSAATVTGITGDLIKQHLVEETTTGNSTGGRKPILLTFNNRHGVAIGAKVTEDRLVLVDTDLDGNILHQQVVLLPIGATAEQVTTLFAQAAEETRLRHTGQPIIGIGIGIAGVVDRPSGVCRYSPFLRWRNVPLKAMIEAATGLSVVVENDVNTLTHAFSTEATTVTGNTFLVVTLGRGIGLGMKLNGNLYRGPRGQGGEYGHITVSPSGPVCDCGKLGCLEAVVSIPALSRQSASIVGHDRDDGVAFRTHVTSGNVEVVELASAAAHTLGESLANLVNILNPESIVISGEGAWLATAFLDTIGEAMHAHVFEGLSGNVSLMVHERDDAFWARGAAEILVEDVLTPRLRTFAERSGEPVPTEGAAW